jgi:uncharacterized membrane protein HdeD (DUF308 family)
MAILQGGSSLGAKLDAQLGDKYRVWLLTFGIVLVLLGIFALTSVVIASYLSVFVLGSMMMLGGVFQMFLSFTSKGLGNFFLNLMVAVLYLIIGFFLAANPGIGMVALTYLIAFFFMAGGLFKIITSMATGLEHAGWTLFGGIIAFILGLMIYNRWPASSLWVIGLCIGVELVISGLSWVSLSQKKF